MYFGGYKFQFQTCMNKSVFFRISMFFLLIIACGSDDASKEVVKEDEKLFSDWYKVSTINTGTHSIEEPNSEQGNVSYLIAGSEKALMFDTGSGENEAINGFKIIPMLEELTTVPITLLLSHFHFDHNQNISEFSNIAFPDLPILRDRVGTDGSFSFTTEDLFIGTYPSAIKVNDWLPVNTAMDLGGRVVELLNIPGHTKESVVIVDKTNKIAFLGDYLYNGSLFLFDNADIATYKESVDYLISVLDADYRLFGAHGNPEMAYAKLTQLKNALLCIEEKNCEAITAKVWGYDVLIYKHEGMELLVFQ